jgi:hypothetical protein
MPTLDPTRSLQPKVPRFAKWYLLSLLVWIAGEALIWALLIAFLKASLSAIVTPALMWLLPPLAALPLIFLSWKYFKQPRLRLLIFVSATFVFFLLCFIALSLTVGRLFRSEWVTYMLPGSIAGVLISTATVYFVSSRRFSDS